MCVRLCVCLCFVLLPFLFIFFFLSLSFALPFLYCASRCRPGQTRKKSRTESKKSYKTLFFFFATFEIRVLRCARKVPLYVCVCGTCVCLSVCTTRHIQNESLAATSNCSSSIRMCPQVTYEPPLPPLPCLPFPRQAQQRVR